MTHKRYLHLLSFALDHPWALTPGMLHVVATIIGDRLAGMKADSATIAAAVAQRRDAGPQPGRGGVAVIPMYGVLAPRANLLTEASGGTSFEALTGALRSAVDSPDVKTIVFDVDSPGGSVAGATEFAAEVRKARAVKPVIAVANHQMASAAYWTMANATKIHASPSAQVGSIGVFTIHNDLSAALEKNGVKRTLVSAGKFKTELRDDAPLGDDALAYLTSIVADSYSTFVDDVAKGRSVAASVVRGGYGEGRLVSASAGLDAGMIDEIRTLDDTLARLLPAGASLRQTADTSQEPAPQATDQDRTPDVAWQARATRDLLDLAIAAL
jgi:signal peptide peptidase SppA